MGYIFLFPGQGAQYIGMGQDFYHAEPAIKELFETASDIGGFNLAELLFNGTIEELSVTDKTQIAITTVNIATAYYLQSRNINPSRVAGFSLGEYAAMVIAGVLSAEDALKAVKMRGDIMERVSRTLDDDSGRSGMVAVLGMSREEVTQKLTSCNSEEVFVAIHNSPEQIVIGGTPNGMRVARDALEGVARRIIPLKVSGPFHTPLMKVAAEQYAESIADISFRDPHIPIYSNVNGVSLSKGDDLKHYCTVQLIHVVEWVQEQTQLIADGGDGASVLEVGPGRVLSGLWRNLKKTYSADTRERIPDVIPVGNCDDVEALDKK